MRESKRGEDTISVTGNVLRDYLTDLCSQFSKLGTSAKMLSIVPLMNGGGLFETGRRRIGPEACATARGGRDICVGIPWASSALWGHPSSISRKPTSNQKAAVLGATLDKAIGEAARSTTSRRDGKWATLDNRGSHFYIAKYWAEALAVQGDDAALKAHFAPIAEALSANEAEIMDELNAAQGQAVDLGGYFRTDAAKVADAMRPSATLNGIIG